MRKVLYGLIGLMIIITLPLVFRILSFKAATTPYDDYIQAFFNHEAVLDFDQQYAMFTEEKQKKLGSLATFSKHQIEMIRRTRQETGGRKALLKRIDVGRALPDDVELTAFIERGPRKETYLFALEKVLGDWKIHKYEELRVVDFSGISESGNHQATREEIAQEDFIEKPTRSKKDPSSEGASAKGVNSQVSKASSEAEESEVKSKRSFEDKPAEYVNDDDEKIKPKQEEREESTSKASSTAETLTGLLSEAEATGVILKGE